MTLYGESGAGKSIMLLDIALTVAQHAPVVYVMAEALGSYKQRSRAWMQHHKLSRGQFHYFDAPIDLMSDVDIEAVLAEMCATLPAAPALVIIDTLAPCFGDGDENSTRDMNVVCRHAHRIRTAFGCTVLICHHTGRSVGHERGSIVLRANCAVMIELKNDDGLISLGCDKNRHGHDFETRYFRFVEVVDTDSVVPIPASRVMRNTGKLSERQLQVLHALTLRTLEDGATFSDLLDATELARSTMHGVLSALVDRDLVEREEQTKSRSVYRLTSRGVNAIQQHDRQQETAQQTSRDGERTTLNWSISTPVPVVPSSGDSSAETAHSDAAVHACSGAVRPASEQFSSVRSGVPPFIRGNAEPNAEQHAIPNRSDESEGSVSVCASSGAVRVSSGHSEDTNTNVSAHPNTTVSAAQTDTAQISAPDVQPLFDKVSNVSEQRPNSLPPANELRAIPTRLPVSLPRQCKGSETESREEQGVTTPIPSERSRSTPDWEYLRRQYALGDQNAIRLHCVLKRLDVLAVLQQLENEAAQASGCASPARGDKPTQLERKDQDA